MDQINALSCCGIVGGQGSGAIVRTIPFSNFSGFGQTHSAKKRKAPHRTVSAQILFCDNLTISDFSVAMGALRRYFSHA